MGRHRVDDTFIALSASLVLLFIKLEIQKRQFGRTGFDLFAEVAHSNDYEDCPLRIERFPPWRVCRCNSFSMASRMKAARLFRPTS